MLENICCFPTFIHIFVCMCVQVAYSVYVLLFSFFSPVLLFERMWCHVISILPSCKRSTHSFMRWNGWWTNDDRIHIQRTTIYIIYRNNYSLLLFGSALLASPHSKCTRTQRYESQSSAISIYGIISFIFFLLLQFDTRRPIFRKFIAITRVRDNLQVTFISNYGKIQSIDRQANVVAKVDVHNYRGS